jgi:Polysaccharide lyase
MSPTINITNGTFNGTITYEDTATTPPPTEEAHGLITSFSASNGAEYQVDGIKVQNEHGGKSWSIRNPDDHTLTFEAHSGDTWTSGGYSDQNCNRTEIQFTPHYDEGTEITVEQKITILPGPKCSQWVVLNQLHNSPNEAPYCPVTLQLEQGTDKLMVVLQKPEQQYNNYIKLSPVVRGREMDLRLVMKMVPRGNGYVRLWLDGAQVVDYKGWVGQDNCQYYWKCGIYRGEAPEVLTATFKNMHITSR